MKMLILLSVVLLFGCASPLDKAKIYKEVLAELVMNCMKDVQYEFTRYGGL